MARQRSSSIDVLVAVFALAYAACSRPGEHNEAKTWQDQPPAHDVDVPDNLTIAIEVDGAPRPAITTQSLRAAKPDFADAERRAWLISELVPEAAAAGTTVEASSSSGVSVKIARPTSDGLEPVLFLDRRGGLVVTAIDSKEPFPPFHGKGGRLHRAGDSMPRIAPVMKLAITRPAHGA